jgi:hypothetical protein
MYASRISMATASDRVVHAAVKNEDTWHKILGHYDAGFDTASRVFEGQWYRRYLV